jgi:hypothetical protein
MKPLPLILLFLFTVSAFAADKVTITTTDGTVYKDVTVSAVEPHALAVETDAGIERIPFSSLSAELQKKYGYDPATAVDYQKMMQAAIAKRLAEEAKEMTVAEQEQRKKEQYAAIEEYKRKVKGGIPFTFKVQGLGDGGALGYSAEISKEPIFIVGIKGVVDGAKVKGKYFPCGRYQYTSVLGAMKTVQAFATTVEGAFDYYMNHPRIKE